MREVVLDTETTGLDPLAGHRIVEIGLIELVNHVPTGANFQRYLNPERDMPAEAQAVHGLSGDFLADKALFAEVAADFLDFLRDSPLVIHNAEFDMRFVNHELARLGLPPIPLARAIDTVKIARKKFPGAPANLDALCRRFEIDNAHRTHHGALLDAELLAEVYLQLLGGRQTALILPAEDAAPGLTASGTTLRGQTAAIRPPRPHAPTAEEAAAHAAFIAKLTNPIWLRG